MHLDDYSDIFEHQDVPNSDKLSFFKFSLASDTDARQHCDSIIENGLRTENIGYMATNGRVIRKLLYIINQESRYK